MRGGDAAGDRRDAWSRRAPRPRAVAGRAAARSSARARAPSARGAPAAGARCAPMHLADGHGLAGLGEDLGDACRSRARAPRRRPCRSRSRRSSRRPRPRRRPAWPTRARRPRRPTRPSPASRCRRPRSAAALGAASASAGASAGASARAAGAAPLVGAISASTAPTCDGVALGGVHLHDGAGDRARGPRRRPCPSRSRRASRRPRRSRPSALCHSSTVPSVTESPIAGMTTSTVVVLIAIGTALDLIASPAARAPFLDHEARAAGERTDAADDRDGHAEPERDDAPPDGVDGAAAT